MADGVFNIAKGKNAYYASQAGVGNAALILLLLTVAEADDTLNNHDTLAAVLAGGNTEAVFSDYARKVITAATVSVDDTANSVKVIVADQTWVGAGGAVNESTVKAILAFDPDTTAGTDSSIIPMSHHTFVVTTDGNDLTADINATTGFWSAT